MPPPVLQLADLAGLEVAVALYNRASPHLHAFELREGEVAVLTTVLVIDDAEELIVTVVELLPLGNEPCPTTIEELADDLRFATLAVLRVEGEFCNLVFECLGEKFHT